MITYVVGDLFQSPARVLVNTVNTVGAMGQGIAKDFKTIYPEMFKQYQLYCEKKQFTIGQLWLYKTNHKWILNFPTKKDWKHPSKLEYIELGLQKFVSTYSEKGITSISFPMLGCGNGGLDWESQVRPLMERYLRNLPIDIFIHLYRRDPFFVEQKNIKEIKRWLRSEPDNLPFQEVWEDIVEVISRKDAFFTIDNQKIGFTVNIVNKIDEGMEFKSEGKAFTIYKDQLVDLWQHIRSLGFFMTSSLSGDLGKYASYLITILNELSYLKPVLISSTYQEMDENPIGLQFIPPSLESGLFSTRDVFEVRVDE